MVDPYEQKVDKRTKQKRISEAKAGKRDFIEDILGTEELSGTKEEREKTAKLLAIDRAQRDAIHRNKLE